jgi:hypothetical protein
MALHREVIFRVWFTEVEKLNIRFFSLLLAYS